MNDQIDLPPDSYGAAVEELERILSELDDGSIDVDLLTARVARAALLIRFCRDRISKAKMEVERIVADMAGPTSQ